MGFRYIQKDMIRNSDFYEWYRSLTADTKKYVEQMVGSFIRENPTYRLSLFTEPGYFMMYRLMDDLYT